MAFCSNPPSRFGALPVEGTCRVSARRLFARSSNGWLSVVPRKFTPATIPVLPVVFQANSGFTETTRSFPLVANRVCAPGARFTWSRMPLRERTSSPSATFAEVTTASARWMTFDTRLPSPTKAGDRVRNVGS